MEGGLRNAPCSGVKSDVRKAGRGERGQGRGCQVGTDVIQNTDVPSFRQLMHWSFPRLVTGCHTGDTGRW